MAGESSEGHGGYLQEPQCLNGKGGDTRFSRPAAHLLPQRRHRFAERRARAHEPIGPRGAKSTCMMLNPLPSPRTTGVASPLPTGPWRLRLLGSFELDDGSQRLTRLRTRAAMLLFARLALAPGQSHPREELCDMIWPQAPRPLGLGRLRQTLSMLRAVLEPPGCAPVVVADNRTLRLVPHAVWCDATAFESAVAHGVANEALGHYSGDLLPGFYDEWVLEERQRLATLAERMQRQVAHGSTDQADPRVTADHDSEARRRERPCAFIHSTCDPALAVSASTAQQPSASQLLDAGLWPPALAGTASSPIACRALGHGAWPRRQWQNTPGCRSREAHSK